MANGKITTSNLVKKYTKKKEEGYSSDAVKLETEDIYLIPLNEICNRFENNYIKEEARTLSLMNAIKEEGQLDPITVASIEDIIEQREKELSLNISEYRKEKNREEIEYLNEQKQAGRNYSIIIGHRRFEAMTRIALEIFEGKIEEKGKDVFETLYLNWENIYSKLKDVKDVFDDFGDIFGANEEETTLEEENENHEILLIKSFISSNVGADEELAMHHSSNLNSRAITNFERAWSAIDQLNSLYTEEEIIEKYGNGDKSGVRQAYINYLEQKYALTVNPASMSRTMKIRGLFDKEVVELIFSDKLSIRKANELLSIYQKIDVQELVKNIDKEDFNIDEFIDKYKNKKEPDKNKLLKKEKKKILDALCTIKDPKMTVEEAIKMIKKEIKNL